MKGDEFLAQVGARPPFSRMNPRIGAFFKEYLSNEKIVKFGEFHVLNTHFPPYPSPAFDNMVAHYNTIAETGKRSLFSVTFAVTNRCMYNCRHCYNAGRGQEDLDLKALGGIVSALQEMDVVHVTLSGGGTPDTRRP